MKSGKSQGITCFVSSPDLLERGRLLLDGELKNLMLPYAGMRVLLYNKHRDYILCRVDSRMGYLRSPDLKGFFSATGIGHAFRIRETDERFFLVEPYKTRGARENAAQLTLFPVSPDGEAAPQKALPREMLRKPPGSVRLSSEASAAGAPAGRRGKETRYLAEKPRQKSASAPPPPGGGDRGRALPGRDGFLPAPDRFCT